MRAWALVTVWLFACTRQDRSVDCDVVHKDPANATDKLKKQYPGDPVKVAQIIERCIAPDGAPCERLAKIVAALPGMMPAGAPAATAPADVAEVCANMPPEMRRCMLPSYALANPDECAKIRDKIAADATATIEIKPGAGARPSPGAAPSCTELRIEISGDQVMVIRDEAKRFERTGGKLDTEALRAALAQHASRCVGEAVVAGADPVPYREVIAIMDLAVAAGFREIGLDVPDPHNEDKADRVAAGAADVSSAPVIVVTRQAVSIGGIEVSRLDADATQPVAAALEKARAANPKLPGIAILQADEGTPMRAIKQIIAGGRRAGFEDVLFAVKNR